MASGAWESSQSIAHILDLLYPWAAVAPRRMFSSIGLFRDGIMFGLVIRDTLYFKTDDANRGDYEAAGMAPFSYQRGARGTVAMSYHAVPVDLLDDGDELLVWAGRAYDAALRSRKPAPRRSGKPPAAQPQAPPRRSRKPMPRRKPGNPS